MNEDHYRYFLRHPVFGEKEVSREEFIKAERQAGFRPKGGGDGLATGGFGSNEGISGRIEPLNQEPNREE